MRGSFAEGLVNNTIDWYLGKNRAYFRKAYAPIAPFGGDEIFKIIDKADIDYYGVCNGRYISFEVKETSKNYFLMSQIKPHQLEILLGLKNFGALSFLLINFSFCPDFVYLIDSDTIGNLVKINRKKIYFSEVDSLSRKIPVIFPGVVDFLSALGL